MKSFISSRGASPECVCTGKLAAWHAAHTGSYDGSLYGVRSRHIVGIIMPRMPGLSASHSISATDAVDVVADRHEADAGAPLRARRAQVDEEAVVRAGARERELGVLDRPGRQAGAERRRLHPGDRVGVREDHLGRDAVGVHLLVALLGVERAAQTLPRGSSPTG